MYAGSSRISLSSRSSLLRLSFAKLWNLTANNTIRSSSSDDCTWPKWIFIWIFADIREAKVELSLFSFMKISTRFPEYNRSGQTRINNTSESLPKSSRSRKIHKNWRSIDLAATAGYRNNNIHVCRSCARARSAIIIHAEVIKTAALWSERVAHLHIHIYV